MSEIIKVFKESIPNLRFIGKEYDNFGAFYILILKI